MSMLMLSSAPMMRSAPIMMSEPAPVEADVKPLDMSEVQGNVVPTGGLAGVKPTYESGVSEPAPEPEPAAPTSTSRPAYVWNPQNLDVPKLPDIPGAKLFEQQFVGEYLKDSPSYLTGALAGDIGFDPWCLVALAKVNKDNALDYDKTLRTADARKAKMLAMSAEEQAEAVAWMRNAELKHARLAMLAAAGWPLAELANGQSMRFATNGRVPSLFNGHLLDLRRRWSSSSSASRTSRSPPRTPSLTATLASTRSVLARARGRRGRRACRSSRRSPTLCRTWATWRRSSSPS